MKSIILSVAALGLASSVSGALTLCKHAGDNCSKVTTNCFEPAFTPGCHSFPLKLPGVNVRYQATRKNDQVTISIFVGGNGCQNPLLDPLVISVGQCLQPTSEDGKVAYPFRVELSDSKMPSWMLSPASPTKAVGGVEPIISIGDVLQLGAGSFVVPSLITSAAAVIFSVLL